MNYTLAITSCQRDDLLERTVKSFLENADQPPREIVIVDDGPDRPMPDFLQPFKHLNLKWLCNGERLGQIHSCDRLWREASHDYVFWCEEDWYFGNSGFVAQSLALLEAHPEILLVALRGDWGHPLAPSRFPCKIAEPNWRGGWGGFTFNPGMRRRKDYNRIGSYTKHVSREAGSLDNEMALSKLYLSLGYVIAVLPNFCSHTGNGRSRAKDKIVRKEPKILLAVPACHRLSYTRWESEDSPLFNKSTAWEQSPYGKDIHISGENTRISAVRETWFRDVAAYPNVTAKFFYGKGATRSPKPDEVFLSCEDDYEHLPHKTIAIVKYALANGYSHLFKADDDSYVWVDRLVGELSNTIFDYAGYLHGKVCTGGPGYWLSKRAMAQVQDNPSCWAEDVWVAKCMDRARIEPVMLTSHRSGFSQHWFDINQASSDMVCIHAVKPEDMRELYRRQHGA